MRACFVGARSDRQPCGRGAHAEAGAWALELPGGEAASVGWSRGQSQGSLGLLGPGVFWAKRSSWGWSPNFTRS